MQLYRCGAFGCWLLAATAASSTSTTTMVVLIGDSMSTGQGIHRVFADHPPDPVGNPAMGRDNNRTVLYEFGGGPNEFCWRDNVQTAAALVAAGLDETDDHHALVNLACAGAGMRGILMQWEYAKTELGSLEGATILLSFGANEGLQLEGLNGGGLISLDTLSTCFQSVLPFTPVNTDDLTDWEELESRIDDVFQTILSEAPASARIRVVGYPLQFRPIFDVVCFSLLAPCGRTFDALMSRMNTILRATTARYQSGDAGSSIDLEFVDIEDNSLLPEGVCSVSNRHIRDVVWDFSRFSDGFSFQALRSAFAGSTFHPTAEAHAAVAGRILESLA